MYYHVYVTGTKLNPMVLDDSLPMVKAFTNQMLYRLQISILLPPILLFLIAAASYANDTLNRKKKAYKHFGRVFITAWFAISFYYVFKKNKTFS